MTRCHQLYGYPSTLAQIDVFGTELALRLKAGYISEYEFGFKRGDKRVLSWFYEIKGTTLTGGDQRPGGIVANVDISGAVAFNITTPSPAYFRLTAEEKAAFNNTLPFQRPDGSSPIDGVGTWVEDRTYSAAGTQVTRRTFRPI